ncbi:hypothetical protein CDAR_598001 [Caerostris darwini]|uniref:G-protein coupled receptors family 1 profile domain-containing protein n=1 Tax=Caerostris darwini TaxID=1538125 RepID=A0AAV4QZF4_9ARAC|nr:hypothetical protein CDAR_598001 [Caerostris darwini]
MESAWCGFPFNDPNRHWETLMLCSTFPFFVVPMALITVLYFRISLTLYRAREQLNRNSRGREESWTLSQDTIQNGCHQNGMLVLISVF